MGLIDLFNQWVTEHGSAAAQEKHIALFRDQLVAADKKIASLNEELTSCRMTNETLKSENIILKEEKSNLNISIENLTRNIAALKDTSQSILLDDAKIKILTTLSSQKKSVDADVISHATGLSHQVAIFHLTELSKLHMVSRLLGIGVPTVWSLAHEGRRYLIDNALIK